MSKKKKTLICAISVLTAIIIAVGAYILFGIVGVESKHTYGESQRVNNNIGTNVTVMDETVTYQTVNGFGASACWWAQNVGGWENSGEILSYLYDDEKGIGLNIYRYNLGAGSENDEHLYVERNRTQCFLQADGTYDFTVDANAQRCLAGAKAIAGDDLRVTLFANSPPVSLTKNGYAYGSARYDDDPWESNLDESNYQAYADYCYNAAEYFVDEGYRVTDVSPINEPQYVWSAWYNEDGSFSCNQEGCHYTKYQARDLMLAMVNTFAGSELEKESGVKVSMFESGEPEGEGTTAAAYLDCILGKGPKYVFKNKPLRDYFDTVCMHSYWSSTETKQETADYMADKYSSYGYSSTEYCQMRNDGNSGVYDLINAQENSTGGLTIEYGVALAKVIMDDLTILNSNEWCWWTACSDDTYTDGLVYINNDDHSDVKTSKRLWCLGNFSRFINEGAVRIACSSGVDGVPCCAFVNKDNSTAIVYVNNTEVDAVTALTADNDYSVYTTSAEYDLQQTANGNAGQASISIPAMSVVTVYIG